MATFESKFLELGFYSEGDFRKFINGRYSTEDEVEIAALSKMSGVERVDKTLEESKPAPKKPARKSSAK